MGNIINTGLGWWADEDWLRNTPGSIGSISGQPAGRDIPVWTGAVPPTFEEIRDNGVMVFTRQSTNHIYALATAPAYILSWGTNGYGYLSYSPNPMFMGYTNGQSVITQTPSPQSYAGVNFYSVILSFGPNDVPNPTIPHYANRDAAFAAFVGSGGGSDFYKLASGYSVCCFLRWINANLQEVVAPILVSTDPNFVPISADGSTPAPGIVTGINFNGTTFYINVLPGYDGTVTSSVPFADITSLSPQGINVEGLFRAIVVLAKIRFDDPYANGGTSEPGGGDGTFDFSSTDIPVPGLPTIGAYNTGFISLFRPSATELGSLAAYLWSGSFDLANFIKLVANPMDCILGLHIIPTAGGHPYSSAATLKVGNVSTGLSMPRLTEQYYELDCGTIQVEPKWGAYLDYAPYSKLSLYLPYIGFVTISPDDCMNGTIRVVYHVDVLSGSVCVYVYCSSSSLPSGHTLYTYSGSCACDCPVTDGQYTNALFGVLRIAGGIVGAAGAGAAGSPGGVMSGLENVANAALSMVKPDISRSGGIGGSAGLMAIQYPYLVLTVPRMCTPGEQKKYLGYPSFVTTPLSSVTGYAQVDVTHLEGMSATDEEVTELLGLLAEGVIF